MRRKQPIPLGTSTRYRYYLVWIKTLPPRQIFAALNEVAIYGLTR
jgi:hypothetical protein